MTFATQTINEFFEDVASATVTPSGGAVAAISGAAGAALCEMVCIHTIKKDGYADVEQDLTQTRDDLNTHRTRLLELSDEDSVAVDELQEAFEISDVNRSGEPIQKAAKRATDVPMKTAEECLKVIKHATTVAEKGNQNAIADAGAGAFFAHAALQASVFTVQLNLELIEDTAFVEKMENSSIKIDYSGKKTVEQVRLNIHNSYWNNQ